MIPGLVDEHDEVGVVELSGRQGVRGCWRGPGSPLSRSPPPTRYRCKPVRFPAIMRQGGDLPGPALVAALVGKFSEGEGRDSFQQGWREGLRWLFQAARGVEMGSVSWGMDQQGDYQALSQRPSIAGGVDLSHPTLEGFHVLETMSRRAKVKLVTKAGEPQTTEPRLGLAVGRPWHPRHLAARGTVVVVMMWRAELMVVHCRHAARELRHGADVEACCICQVPRTRNRNHPDGTLHALDGRTSGGAS